MEQNANEIINQGSSSRSFSKKILTLYHIVWSRLKQDILRHYIILALNVLILAFLFFQIKTYDLDLQQDIRNDVRNLQTGNMVLDQIVTRLKFNEMENYDSIVVQQRALEKYLKDINDHTNQLHINSRNMTDEEKKIKTRLYMAERAVSISIRQIEYIKMNHSARLNSNAYFQKAIDDLIAIFSSYEEGDHLAHKLLSLKEKMLQYATLQSTEAYQDVIQKIRLIEEDRAKFQIGDVLGEGKITEDLSQKLRDNLAHANVILQKTKELQKDIEYYASMPVSEIYSKLLLAYEDLFNKENGFGQKMLILFYMMLIGSWAHIAYLLFEVLQQNKRISQQKEELKSALTQQKQLNILQRKFVSMVSHEFRTPLAIIDTSAQKLQRKAGEIAPEKIIDTAEKTRQSVKRLLDLIDSTLSAQRMEAGELEFAPTDCNIKELLEDICTGQKYISNKTEITTEFAQLPEKIYADPKLLHHVFTNLISNAIKYSPEKTQISVTAYASGGEVVVKVKDSGVGIPQDELPNLFTCFYRASTSTGIPGTGIGLHLVKTIIDRHQGRIAVESVVGEGSEFTVILPVWKGDSVSITAAFTEQKLSAAQ